MQVVIITAFFAFRRLDNKRVAREKEEPSHYQYNSQPIERASYDGMNIDERLGVLICVSREIEGKLVWTVSWRESGSLQTKRFFADAFSSEFEAEGEANLFTERKRLELRVGAWSSNAI